MTVVTSEAVILDAFDLHDQDRIVTFLTREHGKKRGVAAGARRKFSRFAGQLQPLAKVKVSWFEKEGRELVRLSSCELMRSAEALQADLEGILLGGYLADHMMQFAQETEGDDHYFRLLDSTLVFLSAAPDGVEGEPVPRGSRQQLAARYFEAWVLRLAGVFPPPIVCPVCDGGLLEKGAVLDPAGEALVCPDCLAGAAAATPAAGVGRGDRVSRGALEFFLRLGIEDLPRMAEDPPSDKVLAEAEEVSGRIRRSFLQHELKSERVMRETLRSLSSPKSPKS